MANIYTLLTAIKKDVDCQVFPPAGGISAEGGVVPDDLVAFYSECGGIIFYPSSDYPISIVSPAMFRRANPVILKNDCINDRSYHWFIVAESGDDVITIDCHPERLGRCYDSHFEGHAMPGSCPIVAWNFTSLLEGLFDNRGNHWYWLRPGWKPLGDAYVQ